MRRFEWNAMREGDAVHLHHSPETQRRAAPASVEIVHMTPGDNELGIRIDGDVDRAYGVLWPSRLTAHVAPVADRGDCWRCDVPHSGQGTAGPAAN